MKPSNLPKFLATARQRAAVIPLDQWSTWFLLSAGGLLIFAGFGHFFDSFVNNQEQDFEDPLFGISFGKIALLIGLGELIIALLCLFTSKNTLSLILVAWLAANFLVYRAGLWTMGWRHPYGLVDNLSYALNTSPQKADILGGTTVFFLLVGSLSILWKLSCIRRDSEFFKMYCPACGVHIRFAAHNLGRKIPCPKCQANITLRKPEEQFKMACYFCKGHIEFPTHAIGEKMPCPHCKMDITLKELT